MKHQRAENSLFSDDYWREKDIAHTHRETHVGLTKNVLNSMKRIGDDEREEEHICQKGMIKA